MPKFPGWRYLLPSFGLFGAAYAYEYVTWTPRSKEGALKSQFIQQMRAKLSTQIRATSNSYTNQMSNNLSLLLDSLHGQLETTQQEVNNQMAQLTQEQTKYTQLQDKAKKLR
jgi:threonine aldolase